MIIVSEAGCDGSLLKHVSTQVYYFSFLFYNSIYFSLIQNVQTTCRAHQFPIQWILGALSQA
jgi:hypothetical protein